MTEWLSPMFGGDIKIWIEPVQVRDPEMTFKWATLLSQSGAISTGELRALAPFDLPNNVYLDQEGEVPTGRGFGASGVLESALSDLVDERIGGAGADQILASVEGNGRH